MRSIFVIGDSISIHYGPYLKKLVYDKFNYSRKGDTHFVDDISKSGEVNAGNSKMVLEYLEKILKANIKYDIVLLNCGLHDIRVDRNSFKIAINEESYRSNLQKIIDVLKKLSNEIIWISSTSINEEVHNKRLGGYLRYEKDVIKYNFIAEKVMLKNKIPIIDLNSYTNSLGKDIYVDHAHFKENIRELQADFIFDSLLNLFC